MNLIGTGILNWPRHERMFDRYGLVALWPRDDEYGSPLPMDVVPLEGVRGQLIAKVLEARQSTHIGDLFRDLRPETPEVGEEIVLGEGVVFYELHEDGQVFVGLKPEDGRTNDWLDPKMLYRAHAQYVELYFKKSYKCDSLCIRFMNKDCITEDEDGDGNCDRPDEYREVGDVADALNDEALFK